MAKEKIKGSGDYGAKSIQSWKVLILSASVPGCISEEELQQRGFTISFGKL